MRCLAFVVAMLVSTSPMAQGSLNGAYFCAAEFSAGAMYDGATKKWISGAFPTEEKFILRLAYARSETISSALYEVTVTQVGTDDPRKCDGTWHPSKLVAIGDFKWGVCSTGSNEIKFNLTANRFVTTYTNAFVFLGDVGPRPLRISGGTCTKVN
ncbi:unnamed protein product [Phaeothamnion confervicola]